MHQKINQSVCDTCGKYYPNLIALNEHVRVYDGKEHPCTQCDKKFSTSNLLKRHMVIHTSNKFSCDACIATFSRLDNLRRHKMEGCNNGSQEFSCDICYKCFSRERQLKMNIKLHHKSSTITCELCTKVYTSHVHYLYHIELKYPCNKCNTVQEILVNFRNGENSLLDCFKNHPGLYNNYL